VNIDETKPSGQKKKQKRRPLSTSNPKGAEHSKNSNHKAHRGRNTQKPNLKYTRKIKT